MKDSVKYLKQYAALEEAAKAEIIEILSNNTTGHYIWFSGEVEEELNAYENSTFFRGCPKAKKRGIDDTTSTDSPCPSAG